MHFISTHRLNDLYYTSDRSKHIRESYLVEKKFPREGVQKMSSTCDLKVFPKKKRLEKSLTLNVSKCLRGNKGSITVKIIVRTIFFLAKASRMRCSN